MLAGFTAFLTVWSKAAVGIIGDDDSVNLGFFTMVVTGMIFVFRPILMCWMSVTLAVGQYTVGIAAQWSMPGHTVECGVMTFFALLWLTVAFCFYRPVPPRAGEAMAIVIEPVQLLKLYHGRE